MAWKVAWQPATCFAFLGNICCFCKTEEVGETHHPSSRSPRHLVFRQSKVKLRITWLRTAPKLKGGPGGAAKPYVIWFITWWLIPLSKWVITPVISKLILLIPLITGVITHLLSGMSHQVLVELCEANGFINQLV